MVAGFDARNTLSHRLDDSGPFMSHHDRHGVSGCAAREMPIAMANTGCGDFQKNFAAARWLKLKSLDDEGTLRSVQNRGAGFHMLSTFHREPRGVRREK